MDIQIEDNMPQRIHMKNKRLSSKPEPGLPTPDSLPKQRAEFTDEFKRTAVSRADNFDEAKFVAAAIPLFAQQGYNATSVDELLEAMQLRRAKFYEVFVSKHHLYKQALEISLQPGWEQNPEAVDMMIVALKELAPIDGDVCDICNAALAGLSNPAALLGTRLLQNLV
jgi:TetR/AcrR family transcriptional regulator, transcriptional repressor for nem operon